MPSRKRTPDRPAKTKPAAKSGNPQTLQREKSTSNRVVFVLGAGVDTSYGLPTMATVMQELGAFARGEGKSVDRALRSKLGRFQFSFDKNAGKQADIVISNLFSGSEEVAPSLRSVAAKLRTDPDAGPVAAVIEHLCDMADDNLLSPKDSAAVAKLAGAIGDPGDVESLLDPTKIVLSPLPGQAFRQAFQIVFVKGLTLSPQERQTLDLFVAATSNIEHLLSAYFMRYSIGTNHDRKVFVYLIWMFWAFLRVRSALVTTHSNSLQAKLPALGGEVVTFNYTAFFPKTMLSRVHFFHGRLDQYLRLDSREIVSAAPLLQAAVDVDSVVKFVESLRLDVNGQEPKVDIPAIVPPTSFKPVMSRTQLRTWLDVDDRLQAADRIIIVGYSFAAADEHFNDLLRCTPRTTRVLVVNTEALPAAQRAARILGLEPVELVQRKKGKWDTWSCGRLTAVRAKADEITPSLLDTVLS